MKHITIVLGLLVLLGCQKERDCLKGKESFSFKENMRIELDSTEFGLNVIHKEGGQLVFVYNQEIDCKDIIDEETYEEIGFEIDADLKSFKISSPEEFQESNCYLDRDGAWFQFTNRVRVGEISGTKSSNRRWDVNFNLQLYHPGDTMEYRDLIFSEVFQRD